MLVKINISKINNQFSSKNAFNNSRFVFLSLFGVFFYFSICCVVVYLFSFFIIILKFTFDDIFTFSFKIVDVTSRGFNDFVLMSYLNDFF